MAVSACIGRTLPAVAGMRGTGIAGAGLPHQVPQPLESSAATRVPSGARGLKHGDALVCAGVAARQRAVSRAGLGRRSRRSAAPRHPTASSCCHSPGQLLSIRTHGWIAGEVNGGVQHERLLIALVRPRHQVVPPSAPAHQPTAVAADRLRRHRGNPCLVRSACGRRSGREAGWVRRQQSSPDHCQRQQSLSSVQMRCS